ncbi:hypothetical protein B296_00016061 [Ensete ventricosum]|uniref:Uncharacterized protein n=1 Tax=Ensete ventricosum TaxID=4639 RepID=A0A426Z620_ENSVE|nr:hypothetical protein B296_00016061 [Ensete ventricosum]
MALHKHLLSTSFFGSSHMSEGNQQGRRHRSLLVHIDMGSQVGSVNALGLKSCLDRHDGVFRKADGEIQRAHAVAPHHHHWVQGSGFLLPKDVGLKLANEGGSYKHGIPIGFPAYPVTKKLVVAGVARKELRFCNEQDWYFYDNMLLHNCSSTINLG